MALGSDDLKRARSNFKLDGGLVFLNHASHSPLPVLTRRAYDLYLDSWQSTSHQHDIESFKIIEDVRSKLAAMISCRPERIGISSGTSFGFNVVSGGYPWSAGDNVVVSNCEFPAVVYPWKRLASKGVDLRFAGCRNGFIDEDEIISLADESTRVLAVTWVQFNNGYRTDLGKLGRFCLENDILLCVDGIQGMGVIPVDVPSLNIDLFTCGCQKWMLGPCGTGFYYLSERAEEKLGTPLYGWLSVDWGVDFTNLTRYDLLPREGPSRYEIGTYPFQDIRALEASVDFLTSFDSSEKWNRIIELTDMIIGAVESDDRYTLTSSKEESRRSGILNIRTADSKRLFEFLTAGKISVSYREGGVRISPHFYNSDEDIDYLIDYLSRFEE